MTNDQDNEAAKAYQTAEEIEEAKEECQAPAQFILISLSREILLVCKDRRLRSVLVYRMSVRAVRGMAICICCREVGVV